MKRRIVIVGGGPGGAYAARLLSLANPSFDVTLLDAFAPLETFGFGVGLSVSTQRNLGHSDPETFDRIYDAAYRGHGARLHAREGFTQMPGNDQMAIARADLLRILLRAGGPCGRAHRDRPALPRV